MSKIAVIYWSGTGNTEIMAKEILAGLESGGAEAELFSVDQISAEEALKFEKLALGCSSMGDEVLEEAEFEPFYEELEKSLGGKKVALFGSYGWGDGEWMRQWKTRAEDKNVNLFSDGLMAHETPDDAEIAECRELGKAFATF